MAGISHSFLDTLNAPSHEVEELLRDGHPTPAGANGAYIEHHEWHGEAGFGDMWTGEGDEGLEDAEGEEYDEEEGEGDGGSAEVYEEGDEGGKSDAQDGADEIPDDVGRQLDIATADAGISSQKHADILWEEDEEAMKEIHATVGNLDDDWEGIGRKKKRKKKVRRKTTELTEEQAEIVGQANLAYIEGEHVRAVSLLHKVIQDAPNAYQAWVTLAMLHDELGDSVKAMRTYMMAAHIDPKDSGLWSRLGALSRKAGHNEQAMYCFDRAIVAEPTNVDSRWDRAAIYHERGMLQKAIEDYNAILDVIPHNMPAVKELCKIYLGLNDPEKAITLFEGALNADVTNPLPSSAERDSEDEEHGEQDDEQQHGEEVTNLSLGVRVAGNTRIGYEELNMLAELYMDVGDYEKALVTIKQGTRRVRGETDKMDINEVQDDDSDFTDGALHYGMELPLELQVKLGICRLFLNNPDLAKLHFRPLYSSPVSEYSDLYHDVGEAYMQKKMFLSALHVFEVVKTYPVMDSPVLWTKMGQCHAQLGNLQVAMELFENVLEVQPEHATVKLELAAICEELGDEDRYHRLLAEVYSESRFETDEHRGAAHLADAAPGSSIPRGSDAEPSFIREKESSAAIRDKATEEAAEANRRKQAIAAYDKVMALCPRIHDQIARADFLRTTRKLLQRFQTTRAFYPQDRAKLFTGLNPRHRTVSTEQDTDHIGQRDLLQPRTDRPPAHVTEFQGLSFDQWYDVFVKYAYVAVMDGKEEDAQETLKSAFDANVYYHDENRKVKLRLHMICVALYGGNIPRVTELCRWFCAYKPFTNDVYRLYSAMHAGGSEAVVCYAMNSSVKYFMRQIRLMEKSIKANPHAAEYKNPLLLTTYGHILQAGRSYLGAIAFYVKAYSICPADPLINFSLGLAQIQRGMQRKSDNRHLHLMQGFTCMMRYYELRGGNMEASYNVARAFHHVGLNHLAIPYYEKVLNASDKGEQAAKEDESQNLKGEAAYNLSLIYVANGSLGLSDILLRKYCTV